MVIKSSFLCFIFTSLIITSTPLLAERLNGTLETVISEYRNGVSDETHFLHLGNGEVVQLDFSESSSLILPGSEVSIDGYYKKDDTFTVTGSLISKQLRNGSTNSQRDRKGSFSVAAIPVFLKKGEVLLSEVPSLERIEAALRYSNFALKKNSFQQASIDSDKNGDGEMDIFPAVTIEVEDFDCENRLKWRDRAGSLVVNTYPETWRYDVKLLFLPGDQLSSSCPLGFARLNCVDPGGILCVSTMLAGRDDNLGEIVFHELGHNLGMSHSVSHFDFEFGSNEYPKTNDSTCAMKPFVAGVGELSQLAFSAPKLVGMGWAGRGNDLQEHIFDSGVYRIKSKDIHPDVHSIQQVDGLPIVYTISAPTDYSVGASPSTIFISFASRLGYNDELLLVHEQDYFGFEQSRLIGQLSTDSSSPRIWRLPGFGAIQLLESKDDIATFEFLSEDPILSSAVSNPVLAPEVPPVSNVPIAEQETEASQEVPSDAVVRFNGMSVGNPLLYDGLHWLKDDQGSVCRLRKKNPNASSNTFDYPELSFLGAGLDWRDYCDVVEVPQTSVQETEAQQEVSSDTKTEPRAVIRFNQLPVGTPLYYDGLHWQKSGKLEVCRLKEKNPKSSSNTFDYPELSFLGAGLDWGDYCDVVALSRTSDREMQAQMDVSSNRTTEPSAVTRFNNLSISSPLYYDGLHWQKSGKLEVCRLKEKNPDALKNTFEYPELKFVQSEGGLNYDKFCSR